MRDYSVGRGLMSLIEAVCWIGVLVGIGVAFASMGAATRGFGAAPGIVAAIPGIFIGLLSLFGVAQTQMARAAIDSAEYGQQSLKVARDQLEVSKQAMKQSQQFERSFADLARRLAGPEAGLETAQDNADSKTASYASPAQEEPKPAPYADQLGAKETSPREAITHDLNGRKLTENPDGTFVLDGRSFATKAALQEHLRAGAIPTLVARREL